MWPSAQPHNLLPTTPLDIMADPQKEIYTIFCVIEGENTPFSIKIESSEPVDTLKNKIKATATDTFANIDARHLKLYHVDIPELDDMVTAVKQKLSEHPAELSPRRILANVFKDGVKEETLIIVQPPASVATLGLKRKPSADPDSKPALKRLRAERDEAFKIAKSKPPPSNAVTSIGLPKAQAEDPILNGRPFSAVGPPITIYEPSFSTFRAMNEEKTDVEVSLQDYASVKDFLVASSAIYKTEDHRQIAITKPLERVLHNVFIPGNLDDKTSNDGTIHEKSGENAYLLLLRELKNSAGTGDPSLQASFAYPRWWASGLGSHFRERTCCPSFLLSIAGPWMCVQGGILAGKSWTVQPLTDFVWAGTTTNLDAQVERIARLLCSLRVALEALRRRFESVKDTPPPPIPPCFPYITSYLDEVTQAEETITYTERLHCEEGRKATAIFSGTLGGGQPVFIKFVTRYNAPAHRLLMKDGYAPNLRYCSELAAGDTHFMLVMDQIDGHDMHEEPFQNEDLVRIREAKDLLHENGYVFGDLRPNNIFKPTNGRAMLVDFDWCGKENEGKYPLVINSDLECWHSDVKGGGTMQRIHDDHLLEELGLVKVSSQ